MNNQLLDDNFGQKPIDNPLLERAQHIKVLNRFSLLSCLITVVLFFVVRLNYTDRVLQLAEFIEPMDSPRDKMTATFLTMIFGFSSWIIMNYFFFSFALPSLRKEWQISPLSFTNVVLTITQIIFFLGICIFIVSTGIIVVIFFFVFAFGVFYFISYLITGVEHEFYYVGNIGFSVGTFIVYFFINKKLTEMIEEWKK